MRRRAFLTGALATTAGAFLRPLTVAPAVRSVVMPDPVPVPTGRPIVFYAPHPDDETLFMGYVITHHALVGRQVHVVCVTDGAASGARHAINGTVISGWWPGGWHYPAREGYSELDVPAFAVARAKEFTSACGQLGVQPSNVHFEPYGDGTLTAAQATETIQKYEALYPNAGHYTMSWGDASPDHAVLGAALRDLALADPTTYDDTRWLYKNGQPLVGSSPGQYHVPPAYAAQANLLVLNATRCYRAWLPAAGAFAAGYHSVPDLFAAVESGEPNWIHSL